MTTPTPDQSPIERIEGDPDTGVLILCDHATNQTPAHLGDLGLPPEEFARHIAYDIGSKGVSLGIAERLGAPMLATTYSRLVIDPNRGEKDPTLLMRIYDRTIIPDNARVDAAEREARLAAYHRPYHRAISEQMTAMTERLGRPPLLVGVHSFTEALRDRPPRPWHVGVLWDKDPHSAKRLLEMLKRDPDLCVGDNEPYKGSLPGDTMDRHGNAKSAPHVLIELRQDLIVTKDEQAAWAARLAPMIREIAAAG